MAEDKKSKAAGYAILGAMALGLLWLLMQRGGAEEELILSGAETYLIGE